MPRKEKVRPILPGIEELVLVNPVYTKLHSEEEFESSVSPKEFDRRIAVSLDRRIQEITQSSLGHWPAEIQNIEFNDYGFLMSIEVPFVLSSDAKFRRDEIRLQTGFAQYLFKTDNQKKLSNQFLYPMLVNYLIEAFGIKTVNPMVRNYLKNIPQRTLAGRPNGPISSDVQGRVTQEGKAILEMLRVIRTKVQGWQMKTPDLNDLAIQQRIRKRYPASKFKWIPHFLKMCSKLPRRRYEVSASALVRSPVNAPNHEKLTTCTITDPKDWSVIDIAIRVTQAQILQQTGRRIALLKIKALLK
jgi:hypothetical protein